MDSARAEAGRAVKTKPTGAPHPFTADPDTPADPISGVQVCARCHLVGRPGDAHHNLPDPEPDAQSWAAGDRLDRN